MTVQFGRLGLAELVRGGDGVLGIRKPYPRLQQYRAHEARNAHATIALAVL